MKLKEHSIFKSYLFLTAEEEKAWKEDIANWLNDITEKDDGTDYTADDYEVTERFYDDIWDMYDCEKANLNKTLPNDIIAIADIGLWDGRRTGGKLFSNNLNEILYIGSCDELKVFYDRYDVQSVMSHHDGSHFVTYRMLKDGVDGDELLDRLVYGGGLSSRDITRFTTSLVPYVKEVYGIKR